jgi:hypothetical protein
MIRRNAATVCVALGLALGGGSSALATSSPPASVAKTCRGSYVHAVIGGEQKCLRRGEFCAHAYQRQYQRYGFHCTHTDANGRYHLT